MNKPPSQRQLRVSELLRKALSEVFFRDEVEDAELEGATLTVSEVRVSPDMREAKVFVLPSGIEDRAGAIGALNRHRRFLRGELARRVTLKYMPSLRFELDESFERGARIEALLRSPKVARDID